METRHTATTFDEGFALNVPVSNVDLSLEFPKGTEVKDEVEKNGA